MMLSTVIDDKVITLTPGQCTIYVVLGQKVQRIEHRTPTEARCAYNKIINFRTLSWK